MDDKLECPQNKEFSKILGVTKIQNFKNRLCLDQVSLPVFMLFFVFFGSPSPFFSAILSIKPLFWLLTFGSIIE